MSLLPVEVVAVAGLSLKSKRKSNLARKVVSSQIRVEKIEVG